MTNFVAELMQAVLAH